MAPHRISIPIPVGIVASNLRANMDEHIFRTDDHPMANGREAQLGEQVYFFLFPLEDGTKLQVETGQKGYQALSEMMRQLQTEDWIQSILEYEG